MLGASLPVPPVGPEPWGSGFAWLEPNRRQRGGPGPVRRRGCLGRSHRRGPDRRSSGAAPSRSAISSSGNPPRAPRPSQRTEARVAYDDEAIYVAVRAFDSDPAGIKAFLTRRDVSSGVRLDPRLHRLVPRPPHGVFVRGQPGGREAGHAITSTTTTRTTAGTPCGTCRWHATPRAGARSSGFPCRSCASAPATTAAWASRWRATWRA